jgi:N-methylhydantoinase A
MLGQRRIRVGIHTGGTFTDVVALDERTGEPVSTKIASTPAGPAEGFLAGIDKVLDILGIPGEQAGAGCQAKPPDSSLPTTRPGRRRSS